jgi:hypothetical protein
MRRQLHRPLENLPQGQGLRLQRVTRAATPATMGGMPAPCPRLAAAVAAVANRLEGTGAPWWIIGSAAVALHGAQTDVADLDLLTEEPAAAAVLREAGIPARPGDGSDLFRSAVFGRIEGGPLPIEVMGGLAVRGSHGWEPLRLTTRQAVCIGGARAWVPDRWELIALLRRFGRDKDLARAALLEALVRA